MEYHVILDVATDLGFYLAMSGAETFRIEESIQRILQTYGMESEVFAIPNCLIVSIEQPDSKPLTRMRRIGFHGNDLDAVERFSGLSRRICSEKPAPHVAADWLRQTIDGARSYRLIYSLLASFTAAFGYCLFFGGTLIDGICSGLCGVVIGVINRWADRLHANHFFRILLSAFFMALPAYVMGHFGICAHTDAVIIGSLMLLVPGLLFTNAMRDIIHGDTNSGINRIVQVFLIAVAIVLGTATALNVTASLWGMPGSAIAPTTLLLVQLAGAFVGGTGFAVLFNIHGPGMLICAFGGCISWAVCAVASYLGCSDISAYLLAAMTASFYAEIMARVRKYPAISYLVVSLFPMIPGAGIYYTMNYISQGNMEAFTQTGMHTIAIAGVIAVGVLIVSTGFRLWNVGAASRRAAKKV